MKFTKLTKTIILILGIMLTILAIRFIFGGNEDTWICKNGQWIKHGNPQNSPPQVWCK